MQAARLYADRVGLTFQLVDDLLDRGEEDEKTTFLTFLSEEQAITQAKAWTEEAKDAIREIRGSELLCEFADMLLIRKK